MEGSAHIAILIARGDQCDNCGSFLDTKDLINPKSKIAGVLRCGKIQSTFLKLSAFETPLKELVEQSKGWRKNAQHFTREFLESGLRDRAITRDSDWGVPVPVEGFEGKSIYVWFEAVSGYLTATHEWAEKKGDPDAWKEFWDPKKAYHYYVHGKDNIPFHTIVWLAILLGLSGLKLVDQIVSSEYLNYENQQFSKSRGIGIWLPDFLQKYEPDTLRYYLSINGHENSDANFSMEAFVAKTNTELLGKIGNFINRSLSFTNTKFDGKVPPICSLDDHDTQMLTACHTLFEGVGDLLEQAKFRDAFKAILHFAEECNKYIDSKAPWKVVKADTLAAGQTLNVCLQAVSAFQVVLSPLLPFTAEKILPQLNVSARTEWRFYELPIGHKIGGAQPFSED